MQTRLDDEQGNLHVWYAQAAAAACVVRIHCSGREGSRNNGMCSCSRGTMVQLLSAKPVLPSPLGSRERMPLRRSKPAGGHCLPSLHASRSHQQLELVVFEVRTTRTLKKHRFQLNRCTCEPCLTVGPAKGDTGDGVIKLADRLGTNRYVRLVGCKGHVKGPGSERVKGAGSEPTGCLLCHRRPTAMPV